MKKKMSFLILVCTLLLYGCFSENKNNSAEKYKIYFVSDNVVIKEVQSSGNEYIALPADLNKDGYEFSYWYLSDGSIFDSNYLINKKLSANVIVNAKWEKIEYYINYILETGVNNPNPSSYSRKDENIILKVPFRKGYNFLGWYTDKSLNEQTKIDTIIVSDLKNYILYPKWEKIKYTIEYYVNDKVVYIDSFSENDEIELYSVEGLKWYYYKDDELVLFDYMCMPPQNLKLYGYKPNTYKVSLDSNGGIQEYTINYTEGDSIYLPIVDYVSYNYTFNGWYYNGELVSLGNEKVKLNIKENIVLKANWKEVTNIDFSQLTNFNISNDDNDAILLDFTKCNNDLVGKNITVKDSINTLILKGKIGTTYLNFSINIGSRNRDIKIVFDNFNYQSRNNTAFYAKSVPSDYRINIEINGSSSIRSYNGRTGLDGTSYNQSADVNNARNGQNGYNGTNGYPAIEANTLAITCRQDSSFNIYGGNGGTGGNGGNGEGSNGPDKKTAGSGGNGGAGGNGGNAIDIYNLLAFSGLGSINIYGGTGGNGGMGGNGGHATVNYSTDNPDNGGAGGRGGAGGTGGYAICFKKDGILSLSFEIDVTLISGSGGKGGNGGNGGNTVSTLWYSAGKVGAAGIYGAGGASGYIMNYPNFNNTLYYELLNQKSGNKGINGQNGKEGKKN